MMSNDNTKLTLDALNNLSEAEKRLALEILKQYSQDGESDLLDQLKYADFDEIPVDIHTFMHDPRYLGKALTDPEGRFTVFPYWEKCLEDIFPDNTTTKYNNVVFTGAIGLGKSTIAVICLLYLLYRLLCLKDPYLYYGLQPIDKITISLMNITLDNAKGVALDKMNQMILASEWFLAHGEMGGETNLIYRPEKHIEVITASSNNQIIGRALFCVDGETIIATTDGDKKIKDLVNKSINVISYDNDKNIVSSSCTVVPTIKTNEEYQIELEDGSVVKCTAEHRFLLTTGEYKCAKDLTVDDDIVAVTNSSLTYDTFINNIIDTRGQWNIPQGVYWEGHHIIPKCLGGDGNTKAKHSNIIRLLPEEHYIAHKLLAMEHPDNRSLVNAWEMMIYPKGKTKRDFIISAEDYAVERKLWSSHMSKNNPGIQKTGHPWNFGAAKPKDKKEWHSGNKNKTCITNGIESHYIDKNESIPEGYTIGMTHTTHTIKNKAAFSKQKSEQYTGVGNPMYKNGYKVAGGKNGRAKTRYFYQNLTFECRLDLVNYLKNIDSSISISTIRKYECGSTTVLKRHEILQNLRWETKNENKINNED